MAPSSVIARIYKPVENSVVEMIGSFVGKKNLSWGWGAPKEHNHRWGILVDDGKLRRSDIPKIVWCFIMNFLKQLI